MVEINRTKELQNPLYILYKETGFHFGLFFPALIYALLASVGIPLNFSVCYLTAKYRRNYQSIGSNTSILLAFNSFFEILHQSSHLIFFAITVSGINFIPIRTAIWLECHVIVGFISALFMVPLSLDRLFAVMAPLIYRRINQRFYICLHLTILLGNSFYSFSCNLKAAMKNPEWLVTGYIGDLFSVPGIEGFGFYIHFGGLLLTMIIYLIIGLLLKYKRTTNSQKMEKIYRSLLIIVSINVGGYFIGNLIAILYRLRLLMGEITFLQFRYIYFGIGIFVNIGSASNGPILYINSQEYRKVYQKEMELIKNGFFRVFCPKEIKQQQNVNLNGNNNILVVLVSSHGQIQKTLSTSI